VSGAGWVVVVDDDEIPRRARIVLSAERFDDASE
jgi:hypothetical protein